MKYNNKEKIFFSTQKPQNIYSHLLYACKKDTEQRINKKISTVYLENSFKFQFKTIFKIIIMVISGNFFRNKSFAQYNYNKLDIGRHSLSQAYDHMDSHISIFKLNYYKLRYLYVSFLNIDFLEKHKSRIAGAFIDHTHTLNGLFVNFLSQQKVFIYTVCYPRGLYCKLSERKIIKTEDFITFAKKKIHNKKINKKIMNKINLTMDNIVNFKKNIPWVHNRNYKKISKNLKEYDYLIYIHAFTDDQLRWGYDGFSNMRDWLEFTIETLLKNNHKVIIKSHPNYNKYNKHNKLRNNYEMSILNEIVKKYSKNKNIIFILDPIKNAEILSKVSKNIILITHHGTAILESIYLKFKIISYYRGVFNGFKLTNMWKNVFEYEKLLNKNFHDLKFANMNDYYHVCEKIFLSEQGIFGQKYVFNLISDNLSISKKKLDHNEAKIDNFDKNNISHIKLQKEIIKNIEFI